MTLTIFIFFWRGGGEGGQGVEVNMFYLQSKAGVFTNTNLTKGTYTLTTPHSNNETNLLLSATTPYIIYNNKEKANYLLEI